MSAGAIAGAWLCGTLAGPPEPSRGHPAPPTLALATCVDPGEAAARYDGVGTYDGRLQTAHFEIDYDTGSEIVSSSYLEVLSTALEDAWTEEVDVLGWPPPQGSDAYAVQVILTNLPSDQPFGGVALSADCEGQAVGYFLLNTDFWYRDVDYLQDVPAHEFNHLLQYASGADYSGRRSAFFYESTAVWVEDLVHDETNTYAIDFLPGWLADPGTTLTSYTYATGLQYAHFVWDLYLDEGVGGPELVRDLWTESEDGVPAVDLAVEATGQPLPELWAGFLARMAAFDVSDQEVFQGALESGSEAFYAVDDEIPASGDSPASPEALGATFLHLVGPAGQGLRFTLRGEDADGWVAGGEDAAGLVTAIAEDGMLDLSFSGSEAWIGVGPTARDAGDWSWSAEAVADTGSEALDSAQPAPTEKSPGCTCQSLGGAPEGAALEPMALLALALGRARRPSRSGRLRSGGDDVGTRAAPAGRMLRGQGGHGDG